MLDVVLCFKKSISLLSVTYTYDIYTASLMSPDINLHIRAYAYYYTGNTYMIAAHKFTC